MPHPRANPYLDSAARVALRATGDVEPNPVVGCVIEREGKILAIGHHRRFGDLHAERDALATCRAKGIDPRGATMHVTLEPCCHEGKQPPCTEAIIEAGISKVVFAAADPADESSGGAEILESHGISCEHDPSSPLATNVSEPFRHRVATRRPWVIAKWAQTIDGRIATRLGESQWISSAASRRRVHTLRSRVDAVLTGLGTVIADDPMLNARGVARVRRNATRVVIDPLLDCPPDAKLITTARDHPTLIVCNKDMATASIMVEKRDALEAAGVEIMGVPGTLDARLDLSLVLETLLDKRGIASVLIESGPGLLGSFFDADLVDEAIVYLAPTLLADEQARSVAVGRSAPALRDALGFKLMRSRPTSIDLELTYRRSRETD